MDQQEVQALPELRARMDQLGLLELLEQQVKQDRQEQLGLRVT